MDESVFVLIGILVALLVALFVYADARNLEREGYAISATGWAIGVFLVLLYLPTVVFLLGA
jgi:hypothetical protein